MSEVLEGMATDGYVGGVDGELAVSAPGGTMTVNVALGKAFVQGRFIQVFNTVETLTIPASDPTNPRIDRIVVRRDLTNRQVTLNVLQGTPAPSPSAPALTRVTTGIWELSLARVLVGAGVISISNANITDERNDATVCGKSAHTGGAGTLILENNVALQGKTTSAVVQDLTKVDASNFIIVGDVDLTAKIISKLADSISFNNNVGVRGTQTDGTTTVDLIKLNNFNNITVGTGARQLLLLSLGQPQFFDGVNFFDLWHKGTLGLGARVTRATAQTVAENTDVAMSWDTERFDSGAFWALSPNPTRFTIPQTGIYHVWGNIEWQSNASVVFISYRVNGTTIIAQNKSDNSTPNWQDLDTIWRFTSGDYVEMIVHHTGTAGSSSILKSASYSPEFAICKIGQ